MSKKKATGHHLYTYLHAWGWGGGGGGHGREREVGLVVLPIRGCLIGGGIKKITLSQRAAMTLDYTLYGTFTVTHHTVTACATGLSDTEPVAAQSLPFHWKSE